jgi:hypothetical protein
VSLPTAGYVPAPAWSGSESWGKGVDAGVDTDGGYVGLTDLQCNAIPDGDGGCEACCAANHAAGYAAYLQVLAACACSASTCQSACGATLCANPPATPDDACWTCTYGDGDDAAAGFCSTATSSCATCTPYTECTGEASYSEIDGCQASP